MHACHWCGSYSLGFWLINCIIVCMLKVCFQTSRKDVERTHTGQKMSCYLTKRYWGKPEWSKGAWQWDGFIRGKPMIWYHTHGMWRWWRWWRLQKMLKVDNVEKWTIEKQFWHSVWKCWIKLGLSTKYFRGILFLLSCLFLPWYH